MMVVSSIYKSLQRHVVEIQEEIKASTGVSDLTYWSWENRADENELPDNSLIGLSGFEFLENQGLWVVRAGVGISPFDDPNLDLQIRMLDVLFDRLSEGKKVNLLNGNTGAHISEMVVSDFHIAPVRSSELRNYRTISFELLRTDTAVP